jgi:hypothetical protein
MMSKRALDSTRGDMRKGQRKKRRKKGEKGKIKLR